MPVIQAFVEGKTIEYSYDGEHWESTDVPSWDCDVMFRIKPQPKYRPFETKEECWSEMLEHQPFGWIKSKATDRLYNISSIYKDKGFYKIAIEDFILTLSDLFDSFVFIDRTPFGIKEE